MAGHAAGHTMSMAQGARHKMARAVTVAVEAEQGILWQDNGNDEGLQPGAHWTWRKALNGKSGNWGVAAGWAYSGRTMDMGQEDWGIIGRQGVQAETYRTWRKALISTQGC
jgi:hypothetical protein